MTNRKNTRRALVLSLLSLLVCCTMLVGTTFAWFTDSVTSGKNIIIAGNLDVELYHSDKAVQNQKVDASTKLFDDITLWEPGVVAWENLTIANEGTLALKYQLAINFDNAIGKVALADALKVAFIEGGLEATTREGAIAEGAATGWKELTSFKQEGELPAATTAASENTWGVVIYWEPTANDNTFNMNNADQGEVLSIEMGVILLATQLEAEFDSFGNDYDKDAEYVISDPALLATALQNAKDGDVVGLDPAVDYGTIIIDYPIAEGVTLDANGANALIKITAGAVADDLTITGYDMAGYNGQGQYGGAISIEKGADVTIEFVGCNFAPNGGYAGVRYQETSAELTFTDCTFTGGRYAVYSSAAPCAKLAFIGCEFNGHSSWAIQCNAGGNLTEFVVDGCTFNDCLYGVLKSTYAPAPGSTFTFTNNAANNIDAHDANKGQTNIFDVDITYTITVSGNTRDGAAWTPDSAQGLGN